MAATTLVTPAIAPNPPETSPPYTYAAGGFEASSYSVSTGQHWDDLGMRVR